MHYAFPSREGAKCHCLQHWARLLNEDVSKMILIILCGSIFQVVAYYESETVCLLWFEIEIGSKMSALRLSGTFQQNVLKVVSILFTLCVWIFHVCQCII